MGAEQYSSKKEAEKAHAEFLNHWPRPKMCSSEEIEKKLKEVGKILSPKKKKETNKLKQKQKGFRKRMLDNIAGP